MGEAMGIGEESGAGGDNPEADMNTLSATF